MGTLQYGGVETIEIDDWSLRHLQAVIFVKLQRHESFAFHWKTAALDGSGHGSIWITPGVAVSFRFHTAAREPLNREWVSRLMACASDSGLRMLPEPHPVDSLHTVSPEQPGRSDVTVRAGRTTRTAGGVNHQSGTSTAVPAPAR